MPLTPEEVQQLVESSDSLKLEVGNLSRSVTISNEQVRKLRMTTRLVIGAIAISLFGLAGLAGIAINNHSLVAQNHSEIACVKAWADATTQRTDAVSDAQATSFGALDKVFASFSVSDKTKAGEAFKQAELDYVDARSKLVKSQLDHPVPPSPQFVCR